MYVVKRLVCTPRPRHAVTHFFQTYLVKRRPRSSSSRSNFVFCVKTHFFILGPLEKGGVDRPSEFYNQLFLSQLENRYLFCSPWILDLPTALIQVLFLTHEAD